MAMPGSHKGMHLQYKGKSFRLMLLLSFSAALFGVMAVQKLREKRVLSVLLREKDKELSAFQILLQKERDQAQDIEKRSEEMKDMIYTLSSQKRELDSRILEMESTVSSLKEDSWAMTSVLEDRANEIKTLHEREREMSKKESEEASLREIVRMKEVEIEDLTQHLGSSMQESKAPQENMASPDEKQRNGNAKQKGRSSDEDDDQNRGSQDNGDNTSQEQQQSEAGDDRGNVEVVNAGESNGGVDRRNSESGMKFEAADKLLAQPLNQGGAQPSRKRSKRWRVIARNRRMGKRGNRRVIGRTQEDQAQGGSEGERLAMETGTMNKAFGSTNNGDESSKFPSKVDISFGKSANENHQEMLASRDDASNGGEVNRSEENRYGDEEGVVKQPQSNDAGLNNSEGQSKNTTQETTAADGSMLGGYEIAQMENADSVKSTNMDTLEMAENDGNLLARDEMAQTKNTDSVESTDGSSRETEPEDTKQYEANDNWNSFQATPEEKEEEKVDEPEF